MDARIAQVVDDFHFRGPPAQPEQIARLNDAVGAKLPHEYLNLLRVMDGCEGPIGKANYVMIMSIGNVILGLEGDLVHETFPGVVVFASDGGDIAYGFDTRVPDMPIVETSFSDPTAFPPRVVGTSLLEWLEYLIAYEPGQ
ncbi:MAG: SMI1/KNR4 family protein [Phycisphaerae bacterium]|nr:SMI1/KNR4 family protein [Phycisphaerae bacterium]